MFAYFLFALAAWTICIKYVAPILTAGSQGEKWSAYVLWDGWPPVHVFLGVWLLQRRRYVVGLALAVAATEVVVVVTKFVLFFRDPVFDPWRANWFANKLFVLGLFIAMLVWLARPHVRAALRDASRAGARERP